MGLLVPEAGARYRDLMYCLQQGCTVIRLLHMVVVSWAGFGNQATTWGGGTNNEGPFERPARRA